MSLSIGLPVRIAGFGWTVNRMLLLLAMICLGSLSSGCRLGGSLFSAEGTIGPSLSPTDPLMKESVLGGAVPIGEALSAMQHAKLLEAWPSLPDAAAKLYVIQAHAPWWNVIKQIEVEYAWTYDIRQKRFFQAVGSHTSDGVDGFGRATVGLRVPLENRQQIVVRVRFCRFAAGADINAITASVGANGIELSGSVPAGTQQTISSQTERTYTELVRDTQTGQQLPTTRRTVPAGVVYQGLVAALPGGQFRLDGQLEVSSFNGDNGDTARATVSVPLQVDGPRNEWLCLFRLNTAEANIRASFHGIGLHINAGLDDVGVFVRVE